MKKTIKPLIRAAAELLVEHPNRAEQTIGNLEHYAMRLGHRKYSSLIESVEKEVTAILGLARYKVASATKMEAKTEASIKQALGEDNAVEFIVQPQLLGGVTVTSDDRKLDLSLRHRLNNIKKSLETGN